MAAAVSVEYMSGPSLKRLHATLDKLDAGEPRLEGRRSSDRAAAFMPWHGLLAASVAVMAVALSLLAATGWMQIRARATLA